jgi:hypothetical protein
MRSGCCSHTTELEGTPAAHGPEVRHSVPDVLLVITQQMAEPSCNILQADVLSHRTCSSSL